MREEREVRETGRREKAMEGIMKASSMKNGILNLYFYTEITKEEIEKKLWKAMVKGATATYPGGRKSWINDSPILDTSKEASKMYTWDRTGNKVQCRRIVYTDNGGEITKKECGKTWRSFDKV